MQLLTFNKVECEDVPVCNPEAPWKGCYSPLLACNSFSTCLVWRMHSVNSHHLWRNDMLTYYQLSSRHMVYSVTHFIEGVSDMGELISQ